MADIPKFRETLKFYLEQSSGVSFERFDGKIAPVSLDEPASVSRDIADSEIKVDGKNVFIADYELSSSSEIITGIIVRYRPIIPLENEFAKTKYCYRLNHPTKGGDNNFDSEGDSFAANLENAFDIVDEERIRTIDALGIRDGATAELLAKTLIEWRQRQLYILKLDCTFGILDIEMFDKVGCTLSTLPSYLQSKKWFVIGHRITLPVRGKRPGIKIKLIEIGDTSLPIDADSWDEGEGTIDSTLWDSKECGEGTIDNTTWKEYIEV